MGSLMALFLWNLPGLVVLTICGPLDFFRFHRSQERSQVVFVVFEWLDTRRHFIGIQRILRLWRNVGQARCQFGVDLIYGDHSL